jgi:hypothetical protein
LKYVERLRKVKNIIGTDFSLYHDTPLALQIYNTYRNRCLDVLFQKFGFNVIPVARWGDESSYEWCFAGLPKNSTIAISSNGALRGHSKEFFLKGFAEMKTRLNPEKIIFIGTVPKELAAEESILIFSAHQFSTRVEKLTN